MQALQSFYLYSHANSNSKLELISDNLFFAPLRYVFSNRQCVFEHNLSEYHYVHLKNDQFSVRFGLHHPELSKSSKIAIFIAKFFMSILIPLGLVLGTLLKGLALLDKDVRDNLSNWTKPVIYINWRKPSSDKDDDGNLKIARKEPYIEELWKDIKANNLTLEFVKSIGNNPYLYHILSSQSHRMNRGMVSLPMLNFHECACQDGWHNRYHNSNREDIEDDLVEEISLSFPNVDVLRLLSIGPGDLMQDFIILSKLVAQGHTKIDMNFVQPDSEWNKHADEKRRKQLDEICHLLRARGIEINIVWHKKLDKVRGIQVHAMWAIDFDNIYDENNFAATLQARDAFLMEGGKLHLSYGGIILKFKKNGELEYSKSSSEKAVFADECVLAIVKATGKESIRIGQRVSGLNEFLDGMHDCIKKMVGFGVKDIKIDVLNDTSEENAHTKKADIVKILQGFTRGINVEINWVDALSNEKGYYDALKISFPEYKTGESREEVLSNAKRSMNPGGRIYYAEKEIGQVVWEASESQGKLKYLYIGVMYGQRAARELAYRLFGGPVVISNNA